MNRRKWIMLFGCIAIVGVALLTTVQLWGQTSEAQALTEGEAKERALDKYTGEIIETTKKDNEYHFVLKAETGTYLIVIHATNGDVVSITQQEKNNEQKPDGNSENPENPLTEDEVKAKISSQGTLKSIELIQSAESSSYYQAIVQRENEEHTLTIDPYTGKVTNSTKTSQRLLSEKEAVNLALEEVNGEVDDVDFIESDGQTPYYLIEIETDDEREATIQIDAYKKQAITVTWEEQEEDEDDS
ncbi:PepSY domain-containing protein [Metabacillus halosaccharovorans]|uniref:PepSY domain-containing protein n=1 Tax=Metabacillus halosaccharovorans TaxID=930124 RepID=UPI0020407A43|nr:PepSY domain-containing protein [Metabacillus halosaccharovorans]MCM3439679.1 PepSY domain-containing protein [Metabacillus halosaccharovorans]